MVSRFERLKKASAPVPTLAPHNQRSGAWIVQNIGVRLLELRNSRGMNQSQLRSKAKVSRSYLSRIESGQMTPSLGTLEKLAKGLGIPMRYFFLQTNPEVLEDPFVLLICHHLWDLEESKWKQVLEVIKERASA